MKPTCCLIAVCFLQERARAQRGSVKATHHLVSAPLLSERARAYEGGMKSTCCLVTACCPCQLWLRGSFQLLPPSMMVRGLIPRQQGGVGAYTCRLVPTCLLSPPRTGGGSPAVSSHELCIIGLSICNSVITN